MLKNQIKYFKFFAMEVLLVVYFQIEELMQVFNGDNTFSLSFTSDIMPKEKIFKK